MLSQFYLESIKKGISQAVWKGRMELVNENPFFYRVEGGDLVLISPSDFYKAEELFNEICSKKWKR